MDNENKYKSISSILREMSANRNSELRKKVVNVARPDDAAPTSEKSKLAKQGEIKTKIIDEVTVNVGDIEKKKAISQSDKDKLGKIHHMMDKERQLRQDKLRKEEHIDEVMGDVGPNQGPLDEINVGDTVHAGFATKGGAGFKGKVHKVDGDSVHINLGKGKYGDRIVKAPKRLVTKEEVEIDEGKHDDLELIRPGMWKHTSGSTIHYGDDRKTYTVMHGGSKRDPKRYKTLAGAKAAIKEEIEVTEASAAAIDKDDIEAKSKDVDAKETSKKDKKSDKDSVDAKEIKGGKTEVDLKPKTNDSSEDDTQETDESKKARKAANKEIGVKESVNDTIRKIVKEQAVAVPGTSGLNPLGVAVGIAQKGTADMMKKKPSTANTYVGDTTPKPFGSEKPKSGTTDWGSAYKQASDNIADTLPKDRAGERPSPAAADKSGPVKLNPNLLKTPSVKLNPNLLKTPAAAPAQPAGTPTAAYEPKKSVDMVRPAAMPLPQKAKMDTATSAASPAKDRAGERPAAVSAPAAPGTAVKPASTTYTPAATVAKSVAAVSQPATTAKSTTPPPAAKTPAPAAPKAKTPASDDDLSFPVAFARARTKQAAGGDASSGQFTWRGKQYQTNIQGTGTPKKPQEPYIAPSKQTPQSTTPVPGGTSYEKKLAKMSPDAAAADIKRQTPKAYQGTVKTPSQTYSSEETMLKSDKTFGLSASLIDAVKSVISEKLVGDQHKIDANKNGKIDAQDFKLLKGKKKVMEGNCPKCGENPCQCGVKEEVESVDEALGTMKNIKAATKFGQSNIAAMDRAEKARKATQKTFPNVKHTTAAGHPDWEKHGIKNIPTQKEEVEFTPDELAHINSIMGDKE